MIKPLVSVIMPVYNCEKYISKAIDSVLQQNVHLELIIIDDCSTDNTCQEIEKFFPDDKIKYLKNKSNQGVAKSRNRGVGMASGEYIAFLDSDDWWDEDKLEKQLELIQKTECVLCSTARELVDEEGMGLKKIIPVKETITYEMLLHHNCINCSSVLLKKDVAREFPMEHEDSHEDYITWLRILEKYHRACAVNEPLLKYRVSNTGKSGSKWKSARMTFKVYRYMGFNYMKCILYFTRYAANGIWKYR